MSEEKAFFKVPCEFQLRFRELTQEEADLFHASPSRPSPYSALRTELKALTESIKFGDPYKTLIEKAFQLLINMDQRLERMEEQVYSMTSDVADDLVGYQWTIAEIGALGIQLDKKYVSPQNSNSIFLLDFIIPSLPEQRVIATASLKDLDSSSYVFFFKSIHDADRELIHQFVASREREILRDRSARKKGEN